MKKHITILLLSLLSSILVAQNIDPITGFRGFEWGTTINNASYDDNQKPVFNLNKTMGKTKVYSIPSDDKYIGTALINDIYYHFHDDAGLYKVTFSGSEKSNDDMDALLVNRLGNADTELFNTTNIHRIWRVDDVIVDYKEQVSKDFIVIIKANTIAKYNKRINNKIDDF